MAETSSGGGSDIFRDFGGIEPLYHKAGRLLPFQKPTSYPHQFLVQTRRLVLLGCCVIKGKVELDTRLISGILEWSDSFLQGHTMTPVEKQLHDDLKNATFAYQQAEIEKRSIQSTLDRLKWKIEYVSGLLGLSEPTLFTERTTPVLPPTSTSNGSYAGKLSTAVIEDILRRSGRKMRVADIVTMAIAKGYGGPSVDRDKIVVNFASILSRATQKPDHPVFRKVGRGLFTVVETTQTTGKEET